MKKLISITVLFFAFGSFFLLDAQSRWMRSFGGILADSPSSIQQTKDGGFIVGGHSYSFGGGFWLLKLFPNGEIEWEKSYTGSGWTASVKQTADEGYIVSGTTNLDFCVLKLFPNGEIEWQRTYGGPWEEVAYSVEQTLDGGYIVGGYTSSFGSSDLGIWILKLSSYGDIRWEKKYAFGSKYISSFLSSIKQTRDGGYVIAGQTSALGPWNLWVFKLLPSGEPEWSHTYGGVAGSIEEVDIVQTTDGGYIVACCSGAGGQGDFCVLKLFADGEVDWQNAYGWQDHPLPGGECGDAPYSIQQTNEGGYIIVGESNYAGGYGSDVRILKINSNGEREWDRKYAFSFGDRAISVIQAKDGDYLILAVGYNPEQSTDIFVLKISSFGFIDPSCIFLTASNSSVTKTATSAVDFYVQPSDTTAQTILTSISPQSTNAQVYLFCQSIDPIISSLNPESGIIGTPVTVSGSNFGTIPGRVTFNGVEASIATWSDIEIKTAVPSGATTGPVIIYASDGRQSNSAYFTVTITPPNPIISNLSPNSGPVGTEVTISGSNFGLMQGTVTFNGVYAGLTSWTDTQIVTMVPSGSSTGPVIVHTSAGKDSNGITFAVTVPIPPPLISQLVPDSGPVGTQVTIFGSNFGSSQGTVKFNGVNGVISFWSNSEVKTSVPLGATTGPLIVYTSNNLKSNEVIFTVSPIEKQPDLLVDPINFDGANSPYSPSVIKFLIRIKNKEQAGTAWNVKINIFLNGEVIRTENIIRIDPGESKDIGGLSGFEYDFKEKYQTQKVNNATISVNAELAAQQDANPSDNSKTRSFNFYWVDFRHDRDAFSFKNWGAESWWEFTLEYTDFLNSLFREKDMLALLTHGNIISIVVDNIFFLFTPKGLWGNCYGMSSASASYFAWPSTKPINKDTFKMSREEAAPDILKHQFTSIIGTFSSGVRDIIERIMPYDADSEYRQAFNSIVEKDPAEPSIFLLGNKNQDKDNNIGHAVVGYKILELGADEKWIFVYEVNEPLADKTYEDWIIFKPLSNVADYKGWDMIFSRSPRQVMGSDEFLANIKNILKSQISRLKEKGLSIFRTRSPVKPLVTDEIGRRIGYVGDSYVNEIPRASMSTQLNSDMFYLPSDLRYIAELIGIGNGKLGADIIYPINESSAKITIFEDVPINLGSRSTISLGPNDDINKIELDSGVFIGPAGVGIVNANDIEKPISVSALRENVNQYFKMGWIKNVGIRDGLLSKLSAAELSLNKGNILAARNKLEAFINQLLSDSNVDSRGKEYLIVYTKYILNKL